MAEYRNFLVQQERLRGPLAIWHTADGSIYRSAGPEAAEDTVGWKIDGPSDLSRNARGETVYSFRYQKPGQYRISLTLQGNQPASNVIEFSWPGREKNRAPDDADGDGL